MQRILSGSRALQVEFEPHHLRYVSGVSPEQFLSVIEPHFDRLTIPSKGLRVGRDRFGATLSGMFRANERDDGLIFSKD
jgi:hypothetical protein